MRHDYIDSQPISGWVRPDHDHFAPGAIAPTCWSGARYAFGDRAAHVGRGAQAEHDRKAERDG